MNSKIISFIGNGGTGKTTLAYNFGRYLSKNNKVLMIDMGINTSGNLTYLMNMSNDKKEKSDIYMLFKHYSKNNLIRKTEITPQLINTSDGEELYGLTISYDLNQNNITRLRCLNDNINSVILKKYILANNYNNKFDYIIIDTRPDLYANTTKMAMVASDIIFRPVLPDGYCKGIVNDMPNYYQKIKSSVTDLYDNTLVNAKIYWIINEADNTSITKYIINFMKNKNNFLCTFNSTKWLSEFKNHKIYVIDYIKLQSPQMPRLKKPKKNILNNFIRMKKVIDNKR